MLWFMHYQWKSHPVCKMQLRVFRICDDNHPTDLQTATAHQEYENMPNSHSALVLLYHAFENNIIRLESF